MSSVVNSEVYAICEPRYARYDSLELRPTRWLSDVVARAAALVDENDARQISQHFDSTSHRNSPISGAIRVLNELIFIGDNWDDEGAKGYQAQTIRKAIVLLCTLDRSAREKSKTPIDAPVVGPAGEGSIDLYWKIARRTLLINIPASGEGASYYGEGELGDTVSGILSLQSPAPHISGWLTSNE